ncbi:hypothetical protein AK830_g5473 [Neonectria ditissima]|uniref:rRNA adenine N(6)-methyltransferase n=1 Tax=Neonectria ditissima TaxID=78410 RepID=A0A0P7BKP7_9HYPO|nr:hypothetical protein AK830_g5473 [Neonectria ditissima]
MFVRPHDARRLLSRPLQAAVAAAPRNRAASTSKASPRPKRAVTPKRTASSKPAASTSRTSNTAVKPSTDIYTPHDPVGEALAKTGLWKPRGRGRVVTKTVLPAAQNGDKNRVNVTSQGLVGADGAVPADDIMKYLAPSLQRHHGCDLVDINPGAGVWSRKLHEVVQPRRHIMMEKDAGLYAPLLADLTARPNVTLIPESGIVWEHLTEMVRTHLGHQVSPSRAVPGSPAPEPQRNDTLLVSVNLAMYPPKPFQFFECVSTMVVYQFMSSIRTASLFQRYGLVRMLIWINDDGKRKLLPRSIVRRKRSAFEADLACEWIHEVAGKDAEVESRTELRDEWINMESGYETLRRMHAAGITPPPGRETATYRNLTANPGLSGKRLAGVERPRLERPFRQELEHVEAAYRSAPTDELLARLKKLRFREKYDMEDSTIYLELLRDRDALQQLSPDSPEYIAGVAAWTERIQSLKKNTRKELIMVHDNYHIFRQDPPQLLWDQRPYEPLAVRADDFFPNVPCALLDFQPKAMHPLLRETGPLTSRAGDMSDMMLRFWFAHSLLPARKAMDGVWPGFGDLFDAVPSLRDPALGGIALPGEGEICARAINGAQWGDILQAFSEWPFRPTYAQLVGRLVDDSDKDGGDDDEAKASALGSMATT